MAKKKKTKLTDDQKIMLVSTMQEIQSAIRIMYSVFLDTKSKSFIRLGYEIDNPQTGKKEEFEMIFQKVRSGLKA